VPARAESAQLIASSQSSFSATGVAFQPSVAGGGDTKSVVLLRTTVGTLPILDSRLTPVLLWVGAQGGERRPLFYFVVHATMGQGSCFLCSALHYPC